MRKALKWALIMALLFTALWSGAVFALKRGLAGWFDQRRAEGWIAEYSTIEAAGFPGRMEIRLNGLDLADPDTGLAWRAPTFVFFAPAWRPGNITALWPDEQIIATPFEKIALSADKMQAAVSFTEFSDFNLASIALDLGQVALTSSTGWASSLESGHLSLQQIEGPDFTYRLHFEARGMVPASPFLRRLSDIALLDDRIEGITIDAFVTFDAPWDRYAIERARPQITHISLELLSADWGELSLWMAGEVDVNEAGIPEGQVAVKARNWREMVALARELGAVGEALEPSVLSALSFLASLSGDEKTLDTPLSFRNGYIAFGPLPIGEAPDLTIR